MRMLHHSPTRSSDRAIGQSIVLKRVRCMERLYTSHYHHASD
jgi:hypothetical protein